MTEAHVNQGIDDVAYHALNSCFLETMEKHKTGGRKEWNEVLAILLSLKGPVMGTTNNPSYPKGDGSLWDRMGGEAKVKPMLDAAYDRYSSDPLSAYTFAKGLANNTGDPGHIKEKVLKFFSAGIGGPYEYDDKSMQDCHAGLGIDEVAYYQLTYCFLQSFDKFQTGGRGEWNECLAIMNSLHDAVMESGTSAWRS